MAGTTRRPQGIPCFLALRLCCVFCMSYWTSTSRCRRTKPLWQKLTGRLWHVYKAVTKRQFAQRLRRLRAWATTNVKQKTLRQKLLSLKTKYAKFQAAYDHPNAYRTSNTLDRLMNYQDRLLYSMHYFHGTLDSARLHLPCMASYWNFHPYGSRSDYSQRCT